MTKWLQTFYDDVPVIRLTDKLASTLGAVAEDEAIEYSFKDAVKLAGHSCPAVAGAFMITKLALEALYGTEMPERDNIRVVIKGGADQLAYGPQSQVISLITGAAPSTGFKGLGRRFSRLNKLVFDKSDFQFSTFIFHRDDTEKTVKVVYDPGVVPQSDELSELSPKAIGGTATIEEKNRFIELWQAKIRSILLEADKYPGLFTVDEITDFDFPIAQ